MSDAHEINSIFVTYFKWHYGKGLKEFFGVSQNFLWFIAHFFSFKLLLRTLFVPWKRLGESYGGGFNLTAYASAFVINGIMRLVGFCTKIVVLFVGVVSYLFLLTMSLFILVIWVLAPFIVVGSAVLSVTFLAV